MRGIVVSGGEGNLKGDGAVVGGRLVAGGDAIRMRPSIDLHTLVIPLSSNESLRVEDRHLGMRLETMNGIVAHDNF
jgi:hypothetical protein